MALTQHLRRGGIERLLPFRRSLKTSNLALRRTEDSMHVFLPATFDEFSML